MEYVQKSKIFDIAINPRKGWHNTPDIEIFLEDECPNRLSDKFVWTYNQNRHYYFQCADGFTSFLAHEKAEPTGSYKNDLPVYQTTKDSGFGGSTFEFVCHADSLGGAGFCIVQLRGPWSSGSHAANHFLAKQVCEVTFYDQPHTGWAGMYLTIQRLNDLLPIYCPGFTVELNQHRKGGTIFADAVWKGQPKVGLRNSTIGPEMNSDCAILWSEKLIEEFENVYQEKVKKFRAWYDTNKKPGKNVAQANR